MTTPEETKSNVEHLVTITGRLDAALKEMDDLNMEQKLLEMEQTQFPQVAEMFKAKDPYERLWNTVLTFSTKVCLLFFFSFSSSHNSSEKLQTTSTVYLLILKILKILNTWARIVYKRYNELFTVERAVAQRAVLEPERRRDRQRGAGDVAHNVPHDEDLQRGARAAACREPIQNAHRQVQAAPAPNARYFNFEYALCTSIFDVYVSVMMVVHSTELYKCACTILYS